MIGFEYCVAILIRNKLFYKILGILIGSCTSFPQKLATTTTSPPQPFKVKSLLFKVRDSNISLAS